MAGASPLFLGVAFDEGFVDVAADEEEGLFFEGMGVGGGAGALLGDDGLGLGGGGDVPHLVEGVHVEGEVVEAAVVVGDGGVGEVVEGSEAVDVLPDGFVAGVEDVGAIAVDGDAGEVVGVGVARDVGALFDDEAAVAGLGGLLGKDGPVKPRTNDEVVVRFAHDLTPR